MNLPDKPIRDGLASAIEGIIHEGRTVDVAESFNTPQASWPRILIENINSTQNGGKGCYLFNTTLTITVSDRRINVGNSNDVEAIADQIVQILTPSDRDDTFPVDGFSIWGIELQGTPLTAFEDNNHKYTEKSINLLIKSEQL